MTKKELGLKGENLAAKIYKNLGHEIMYKNLSTRFGEIDLITQRGESLYLIEVKIASSQYSHELNFEKWMRKQRRSMIATIKYLIASNILKDPENLKCEFISFDISDPNKVRFKRYKNLTLTL